MNSSSPMKSANKLVAPAMEKKWAFPLIASSLVCILLLITSFNMGLITTLHSINSLFSFIPSKFVENERNPSFIGSKVSDQSNVPRFAYLISGSKGDIDRLWRTLLALYHPLNHYLVHLDLESSSEERLELMWRLKNDTMFSKVGNVYMIEKANMVTYKGPTMVANTLHACAILLKKGKEWNWFINLSASDYPLVTQDDLMYAFTNLSRNLNFIEHTSRLSWKEDQRAKPMILDPGLYLSTKENIHWLRERRPLPNSFKLFTGSAWMILSRAFVEYCIWGWDNLPRTLLMYYANFVSSSEGYFQTVICNVPEFAATAINHDMHFIKWDNPPKQHPRTLTSGDLGRMIGSSAPFARKFGRNDTVMDKIDTQFLHRSNGSFTIGGWCSGQPLCSEVGDRVKLQPGPGAQRLQRLVDRIVNSTRGRCR